MKKNKKVRCHWANTDLDMMKYHDKEWGVPIFNDRKLFEFLILEGAQAGLSWAIVLKKRPAYRKSFDNFDPVKIAKYKQDKITALLNNPGIIRNRGKIAAAIGNAKAFLAVKKEFGSFTKYIWQFVNAQSVHNKFNLKDKLVARDEISDAMAKDLKKRGFKFVGTTICYAFMQAVGMVNDHVVECFRYQEIKRLSSRSK